ncbi:class I SAM-dependent methyltransferase [Paenibacillus sp. 481]|uniref:class I SAM-dependent methyltransferase n=1 Tax=Paenibacillus sp. 481 TaxID=2835869 RepID=UPI001E2C93FB|nr:class I SAM-dependent methyltransferase [Paenibacillus sp. 481]UHA74403.1 methyltransferase domain-containing protein [Paenibacillus sp. 481]
MSEWYERSFGEDYLLVYKHRDFQGAAQEVHRMMEWLQLPKGAQVLDLCCGMGRHSMALADAGYTVTGMDLSEVLLQEAVAFDQHNQVTFIRGDMRNLPMDGPFDAVVNLFTSFGYFVDDADNAQVFTEIERVLKPGGRYIIDFLNPSYLQAHLVPHSERVDEGTSIQEDRTIEDGFVKKNIVLTDLATDATRRYEERVKLYELADFDRMLSVAGLCVDAIYGSYDADSYSRERSARLIITGHKR